MQVRVGQGFDVHRFAADEDRPLVLGGVRFEGRGLAGQPAAVTCISHAVLFYLLATPPKP